MDNSKGIRSRLGKAASWLPTITVGVLGLVVVGSILSLGRDPHGFQHQPLLSEYVNVSHGQSLEAAKIKRIDTARHRSIYGHHVWPEVHALSDVGLTSSTLVFPDFLRFKIQKCPSFRMPVRCGFRRGYVVIAELDPEDWSPDAAKSYVSLAVAKGIEATEKRRLAASEWTADMPRKSGKEEKR